MRPFLLTHLLEEAANRAPDQVAVVDARQSLSYAELDRRANRLANLLRDLGVQRGGRVGLFLDKSVDAIVGVYGILKAGGVYVPLDPAAPTNRLGYIARNCEIGCLVTDREKSPSWGALIEAGAPVDRLIVMNSVADGVAHRPHGVACLTQEALEAASEQAPPVPTISQDLAYILYTSGSTGRPKGVMLSHLNALTFVAWCYAHFRPTASDVFSNHAPFHFDLTILDVYVAAMAAARLVLVPPEISMFPVQLAQWIEQRGITIWYSVPSVLSMLVLRGNLSAGRLPSLRHVIFAGEVFPTKHLRRLSTVLPHAEFTNLYGPTETNVCTYYRVPKQLDTLSDSESIPIGRAIDDVEVFAVTDAGRWAEPGEVGELYVRGGTVACGYWGDAEKTARAFSSNSFGPTSDRVYRTGDLVRQNADGEFLFIGRKDHQIKSRGYRIELGDIEAALHSHPLVSECAVIPVPDEVIGNRLKAFVVAQNTMLTENELSKFCAQFLPKYMIPESFAFVQVLPRTSTGKVDRTMLVSTLAQV